MPPEKKSKKPEAPPQESGDIALGESPSLREKSHKNIAISDFFNNPRPARKEDGTLSEQPPTKEERFKQRLLDEKILKEQEEAKGKRILKSLKERRARAKKAKAEETQSGPGTSGRG